MPKFMNDELRHIRDTLICAYCNKTFKGSDHQAHKVKYSNQSVYCSKKCRHSAISNKFKKVNSIYGPCPTCGEMFESKYEKIFCSLACYNASPEFKKMGRQNCAKGRETSSRKWDEKMKKVCPVCGEEFRADVKHRKFCSRPCYRKFQANLFDAWIANPQKIEMPQCYDEFMLQGELPCLVEGCNWKGQHLSIHLNQAHGILAEDFKKTAGFNLTTGLVTPKLHKDLSERAKTGVAIDPDLQGFVHESVDEKDQYRSREGAEHKAKARALAGIEGGPMRICRQCGEEFQQTTKFGKTIYCSKTCRTEYYRNNTTKIR